MDTLDTGEIYFHKAYEVWRRDNGMLGNREPHTTIGTSSTPSTIQGITRINTATDHTTAIDESHLLPCTYKGVPIRYEHIPTTITWKTVQLDTVHYNFPKKAFNLRRSVRIALRGKGDWRWVGNKRPRVEYRIINRDDIAVKVKINVKCLSRSI